jgi:uncharacterized protein (TIGR02996 family)
MNEAAFLAALRDEPTDELTWQALADWLEEDGLGKRAELLRLTRKMLPIPVTERDELAERYVELLEAGVRPVVVEMTNSIGMRFALIPAGRFLMGSPEDEDGRYDDESVHDVELRRPFWLGVFPVTQRQWKEVMGNNPSFFCAGGSGEAMVQGLDTDDFPVENVSWQDARKFLKNLSALPEEAALRRTYRLPTEAQWEYACRAGTGVKYAFCLARPTRSLCSTQANFDGELPYGGAEQGPVLNRTSQVGGYEANPFGLYDVHGNVFEWCSDWHGTDYYLNSPEADPKGPRKDTHRVARGGSWSQAGRRCRSADRSCWPPRDSDEVLGFRVALAAV